MPLSKAKQAEYMKDYRKRIRYNVIPKESAPVIPSTPAVIPKPSSVIPKLSIPGLKMEDNKIIGVQPKTNLNTPAPLAPWYDRRIHKTGDLVRMQAGNGKTIEITVPELDADGNPVYY
ncbi:hypothetical protein LCGC14_2171250 [marine sediment metagenome]|uniref:Uncharacterized protein n=1 Tax=marine sediment metagenome TaxID=412755 RepID=A0A0F9G2R0_9ZZZZ